MRPLPQRMNSPDSGPLLSVSFGLARIPTRVLRAASRTESPTEPSEPAKPQRRFRQVVELVKDRDCPAAKRKPVAKIQLLHRPIADAAIVRKHSTADIIQLHVGVARDPMDIHEPDKAASPVQAVLPGLAPGFESTVES